MSKFPDPTKDYKGEPLASPIDLSQTPPSPDTPLSFQTPSQPFSSPPPIMPAASDPALTPPSTQPVTPGTPPPVPHPESVQPHPQSPPLRPSPFRNLIPLLIGGGVFVVLMFVAITLIPKLFTPQQKSITLTYWGLWEPSSVMQDVIAQYEASNPGVKIVYTMQSPKNYRTRLENAIAQGNAPDIARIHNTWLPMFQQKLSPAPDSSMLSDFYPIVSKNFLFGDKLYALPLMIDGLALFYNQSIFDEAKITPPSDWNSLRKLAFDLTLRNPNTGIIERAGIALGTTGNISHWSDILGLLIMQSSGNPGQPDSQAVKDAITFFTAFSTLDKTWDETQPNDIYAFATGTLAMVIAPSWQSAQIAAINPDLDFGVVPTPTLPETKTSWATYWAEAVPISSSNQAAAWDFINYLASPDTLTQLYANQAQLRPIGEIYPRRSMSSLLSTDKIAGAFVNQANNYTSWYLSSKTYDEGVNDELIKYYEDAINAINQGSSLNSVEKTLSSGVSQVLTKYPKAK